MTNHSEVTHFVDTSSRCNNIIAVGAMATFTYIVHQLIKNNYNFELEHGKIKLTKAPISPA